MSTASFECSRALVVHRREDALNLHFRVQVLTDHRQRVLELDEPAERQILALDWNDDPVRGDERVDRQQPERRRRVDEDVVVLRLDADERLLERTLAADHRRERELGAGKVDRGNGDVHLGDTDDLLDRKLVDEHVEHRALDLVRVPALAHRQVPLGVQVDEQDRVTLFLEGDPEVQRSRRFRHAALLVGERNDPAQRRSLLIGRGACVGTRK